MTTPLTEQQLDTYAQLAILTDHDGLKLDPQIVTALVDEVRRLQQQQRFLLGQIARKDTASGAGDRAVAGFLAVPADGPAAP